MFELKLFETPVYPGAEKAVMQCYVQQPSKELTMPPRPAVVIFPGGAYIMTSDREAEPVAHVFMAAGYSVFVVRYNVAPICNGTTALLDAAQAIRIVRERSKEFNIDPHKVAVCGFSAGGHLAAWISTDFKNPVLQQKLGVTPEQVRPDAAVLGYPVISAFHMPHRESFCNLLHNPSPSEEDLKKVSIENLVDSDTCQMFVWATSNDDSVGPANSLRLCEALSKMNVLYELHFFPKGWHGISVATLETSPNGNPEFNLPYVNRWTHWVVKWLENVFYQGNFVS